MAEAAPSIPTPTPPRYKGYEKPLRPHVFAVYLLVSYMCAKIRVWSYLVTGNFGLFTEIAACKFLLGLAAWKLFILSIVCVYIFLCIFSYGALCLHFGWGSIVIIIETAQANAKKDGCMPRLP